MNSYSSDQLARITNDDLHKEFLSVRSKILYAKKNGEDSMELEIYYCYITRELDYREKNKLYVQQNKN